MTMEKFQPFEDVSVAPIKNGDVPTKNGDFPTTNGDFPTKNGDFRSQAPIPPSPKGPKPIPPIDSQQRTSNPHALLPARGKAEKTGPGESPAVNLGTRFFLVLAAKVLGVEVLFWGAKNICIILK